MKRTSLNQSGVAVLTILGLVVVVGIVTYAGIRVLQVGQSTRVPISQPDQQTKQTETKKTEDNPFTKTYDNAALGLTFTYPSAWTVTNAGRIETYSFRLVSTGEPVTYNTNSNLWYKKSDKKNAFKVDIVKSSPNYKLFDFKDGGNTSDPDCREQNYVLLARGQVVSIFIPKACPADKAKNGEYTLTQRDKDVESFLASLKDL